MERINKSGEVSVVKKRNQINLQLTSIDGRNQELVLFIGETAWPKIFVSIMTSDPTFFIERERIFRHVLHSAERDKAVILFPVWDRVRH